MDVFAREDNIQWAFMRYIIFDSPIPSPTPLQSFPPSPSRLHEEEHYEARFAKVLKFTGANVAVSFFLPFVFILFLVCLFISYPIISLVLVFSQ